VRRTMTSKETPLNVLARTNLAKYLNERQKLAEKNRSDQPDSLRGRCVLVLSSESTFAEALNMMHTVRVQSVPLVRYKAPRSSGLYDALCFLSIGDLVATLIEHCDKAELRTDLGTFSTMARLATIGLELESLPLKQARTKWDGTVVWKGASSSYSLADCLDRCLYISSGTLPGEVALRASPHRFAVMSEKDNTIEYIVSQSDIVMYLHTNRDILTGLFTDATVQELGLAQTPGVATVPASMPTIECFREMERHRVGAVAIVDEATRALIGTLSESDLTRLHSGASFAALALPVAEFIMHVNDISCWTPPVSQRQGLFNPNSSAFSVALMQHAEKLVVACRRTDTLTDVLTKMDVHAVHRVWIVDDQGQPTGVISLADVLACVSNMGMSAEDVRVARAKMMVA